MTFSEKLDRAKIGSRAAYDSLCLTCIDSLYTCALISLRNDGEAHWAVSAAINDGYSGIARIKDEKHLRSWLVHELTKNIVNKLKILKANGIFYEVMGVFAATEKLPDVERLVFSVAASFGYGAHEISVLTGISEESVTEKLTSARTHLGINYERIVEAMGECFAPDSLKNKYKSFDESVARLERTSVFGAADIPDTPEIAEESALAETEEPATADDTTAAVEEISPIEEEQSETSEEEVFAEESEDNDTVSEEEYNIEDIPDSDPEDAPLPLNAETFIAVVSSEKMKGSEFLRLIGNTRISNSVYREIEQNPKLTKKRLIELLEQSPLTENDYYKLLMAVKHRREILDAKEELQAVHERAGLFGGVPEKRPPRRRKREEPKTELQMALEKDLQKKDTSPFSIANDAAAEKDMQPVPTGRRHHSFVRNDLYEKQHSSSDKKDSDSLSSIVSGYTHDKAITEADSEPFSPVSIGGMPEGSRNLEAVDPIAALYANEMGEQAKPERINNKKLMFYAEEEKGEEKEKPVPTDGTQEFTVEAPAPVQVSDTRPLDMPFPKLDSRDAFRKLDNSEAQPMPDNNSAHTVLAFDEESKKTISDRKILEDVLESKKTEDAAPSVSFDVSRGPVKLDLSVTQIISDYGSDTTVESYEEPSVTEQTTEPEPEPVQPAEPEAPEETDGIYSPDIPEEPGVGYSPDIVREQESEPEPSPEPEQEKNEEPFDPFEAQKPTDHIAIAAETPVTGMTGPIHIASLDDADDEEENDSEDEDDDRYGETREIDVPEPVRSVGTKKKIPEKEESGNIKEEPDETDEPHYKGNEYFVDDDKYEEGVNNGKLIFCAVCAALLVAGSVAMKLIRKPDKPVDTVAAPVTAEVSDNGSGNAVTTAQPTAPAVFSDSELLAKLSSYDEIAAAGNTELRTPQTVQYLSASAKPYDPFLSGTYKQTAAVAYIYNEGAIRTVSLDPAAPVDLGTAVLPERNNGTLLGFTAIDGAIYSVTQTDANTAKAQVYVDMFDSACAFTETYSLPGTYAGMGMLGGKPVIVTHAAVNGTDVPHSTAAEAPAAESVVKLNGAEYAGFTVIGEVGGSGLLDILGGCASYAKFDEKGLTVLAEDGSSTFAVDITETFEAENARRFTGAAFSADCLNGDSFIGAGSAGVVAVKGKNAAGTGIEGEKPYAVAWQGENTACVLASRTDGAVILYGFDMSGETPAAAQITDKTVYSDKLTVIGDNLYGLKAEASADGERVGLRLSRYAYGTELSEKAYAVIEIDKNSPRENLKYLASPAENDPSFISANEDGSIIAVPTVYFDGFSEVERIVTFSNGNALTETGELLLYDEKSPYICTAVRQDTLLVITDSKVITANATDCSDVSVLSSVAALAE